jgi:hypothetical protein
MRLFIFCAGFLCALTVSLPAAAQECPEQRLSSPNGPGVMVNRYCRRTEGQFRDGLLQGKGKITQPNNRTEEGDFSRGRLWGNGKITFDDSRVAEGQFVDGRLSGLGKLTWPNGRLHEGMFHNGSPDGPGRYRNAIGETYEGMFDSGGDLVGRGIRTSADGTKIYGEFRRNYPFGEVTLVKADGSEEKLIYATNNKIIKGAAPASSSATANSPIPTLPASPSPASIPDAAGQTIQEVDRALRGLRGLFGK